MAALKKRNALTGAAYAPIKTVDLTVADANSRAIPSPAHDLQASLEAAFGAEPYVQKWSPAARLAILGAVAAGPWLAIAAAVAALRR
jgi:hypothetical protein